MGKCKCEVLLEANDDESIRVVKNQYRIGNLLGIKAANDDREVYRMRRYSVFPRFHGFDQISRTFVLLRILR
jgi:hypothetical protein